MNWWIRNLNTYFASKDCLFGFERLTKNADLDKYNYRGYYIGFGTHSEFLFTNGSFWKIMSLFLELIWAHQCILIIREKISYDNKVKDQHTN